MEQFNAGDYLKKQLGLQPEKPEQSEQEQKEVKPSMTTGRMEDVRELCNKMDLESFLGIKKLSSGYVSWDEKEQLEKRLEKAPDLIKEFLSNKENLDSHTFDSNTKEKLYGHIFEETWKPKLEEAFNKMSEELKELELIRKGKKEYDSLSEEEKSKFYNLNTIGAITGRIQSLSEGLKKLEEFGFDEQRLNGLKEQLKVLKKPVKKPKI